MKQIIYQIIISLLFISCSNTEQNDLEKEQLKGKIKSIQTITFKGSLKFGQVVKDEPLLFGEYKTFNEKGYITKITKPLFPELIRNITTSSFIYDEKGKLKEKISSDNYSTVSSKAKYEYNEKGLLEKINGYASTGELLEIVLYKYDMNNNPVEITHKTIGYEIFKFATGEPEISWVNWDDVVKTFKYEYNNSKITKSIETQIGIDEYSITRIYDKKSNLLEEKKIIQIADSLDNTKEIMSEENIYTYEKNQLIKEVNIIRYPNRKETTKTYKYDSKGNVIQVYEVSSNESEFCSDYEYDHHNNWIKKVIARQNSTIVFCEEREINYYGETEKNEFPTLVDNIREQEEFETNCTAEIAKHVVLDYMDKEYPDWEICSEIKVNRIEEKGECKFNVQYQVLNPHYSYIDKKEQIIVELSIVNDFTEYDFKIKRGLMY